MITKKYLPFDVLVRTVPLGAAAPNVSSCFIYCPEKYIDESLNDISCINFKLAIYPEIFKLHLVTPSRIVLLVQTKVCTKLHALFQQVHRVLTTEL